MSIRGFLPPVYHGLLRHFALCGCSTLKWEDLRESFIRIVFAIKVFIIARESLVLAILSCRAFWSTYEELAKDFCLVDSLRFRNFPI